MTSGGPKGVALRYLGLGAGIQSSAIVEMMVLGILPKVDLAVFSDLEDEPSYLYRQLTYLEGRLQQIGAPLVRLQALTNLPQLLGNPPVAVHHPRQEEGIPAWPGCSSANCSNATRCATCTGGR